MTQIDTSALGGLKTGKPAKKAAWEPLMLADLLPGRYLACDQSLKAAGLVLFQVGDQVPRIVDATALTTDETGVDGWEDVLQRTEQLQHRIRDWMLLQGYPFREPVYSVHEAPPVGGGSPFLKPELSLVTAYAFRQATEGSVRLPMVRPQDHKRILCGDANASKTVAHSALKRLYLPHIMGNGMITNAAHRDALSVALVAASRRT